MEYDFRNRTRPPYNSQIPINHPAAHSSTHPMYGHPSLYPKVSQPGPYPINPPVSQPTPYPVNSSDAAPGRNPSSQSPASSPGIGIRVSLKPDYRITPPPQLSPQIGEIPRSNFLFDFEFERKILAEAEKGGQNWSRLGLENISSKAPETAPLGSTSDPIVSKYIASGLNREAATLAVANYGDNPTKVREFASGYSLLLEMGFSSNSVVEALLMYDNDTSKALALCLNSSSQ